MLSVAIGDVPVNLATRVFIQTGRSTTWLKRPRFFQQQPLVLPQGWKGVVAPDVPPTGRQYLAIANMFGKETQTLVNLSLPQGAPVLSCETTIVGRTGSCMLKLPGLETFGQTMELFVESLDGKNGLRPAGDAATLSTPSTGGRAGEDPPCVIAAGAAGRC